MNQKERTKTVMMIKTLWTLKVLFKIFTVSLIKFSVYASTFENQYIFVISDHAHAITIIDTCCNIHNYRYFIDKIMNSLWH